MLAAILERDRQLVAHLIAHHPADADPAGLGQSLQPRGDVDAVAENVVAVVDDVAEIDPDAELDAPLHRHRVIAPRHLALHLGGASHGIDDAGQFDEQPVSCRSHNPPVLLLDFGVGELAPQRRQGSKRPLLTAPTRRE